MAFDVKAFRQALGSAYYTYSQLQNRDHIIMSNFTHEEIGIITAAKNYIYNTYDFFRKGPAGVPFTHMDIVVAGGVFASWMYNETPKDTDVFILNNNKDLFDDLSQNLSWKIKLFDDLHPPSVYFDNSHIKATATNDTNNFQLILTDYKTREELIAGFDYKHCTVSWTPYDNKLYITRGAYDCIRKRILIPNNGDKPKIFRQNKFVTRGWTLGWVGMTTGTDGPTKVYNPVYNSTQYFGKYIGL